MDFLKDILLFNYSDIVTFILLHKYAFVAYIFNITLTLYCSRHLPFYKRSFLAFKNVLFMLSIQMIRILAKSL
mgnify:CR=1 FL=1